MNNIKEFVCVAENEQIKELFSNLDFLRQQKYTFL